MYYTFFFACTSALTHPYIYIYIHICMLPCIHVYFSSASSCSLFSLSQYLYVCIYFIWNYMELEKGTWIAREK